MPVLLMHLALWAPIGAVAGLVFGMGRWSKAGPVLTSAMTGAMGGALGAVIFQMMGTLVFPQAGVDKVFSTTAVSRVVALLIVAVAIGFLSASAQGPGERAPRTKRSAVA